MELDLSDRLYFFGISYIEETSKGFFYHRMPAEMEDFYRNNPWGNDPKNAEAAEIRAMNTAGVRTAFIADCSSISICGRYGRTSRLIHSFDVIVDGKERITLAPDELYPERFSLRTDIPGNGLRRIEIFFPNMAEVFIETIELQGDNVRPLPSFNRKWLFIGDSLTQGMTVSSPSLAYAARISLSLCCDWQNVAVGGAVMRNEIGEMALGMEWNIASVSYGGNDFNSSVPLDFFYRRTTGMLNALSTRKNARLFLISSPPWLLDTRPNSIGLTLDDYRKATTEAAAAFPGVELLNGLDLLPGKHEYFADGIHPNDEGMRIYSDNIVKKINLELI